jgi:DnaK suppressor protein
MEEEAQMVVEQDLAVQSRNVAADLLRQIWAALDRITGGTYGTCVSCGLAIPQQRLEAVPWAAYCTHCQEELDLKQTGIVAGRESAEAKPSREEQAA